MLKFPIGALLLLASVKTCFAQDEPIHFYVNGQKLISNYSPYASFQFDKDFVFAGQQSFALFHNSAVTQFYFVKTKKDRQVVAVYTVQFGNYSPGTDQRYNYKIKDSIGLGGVSFLRSSVYNETSRVLADTIRSDSWYRFSYLKERDYVLPSELIGHRFIRITDDGRSEVLIIYNEALSNTGLSSEELENDKPRLDKTLASLLQKAINGFSVIRFE